VLKQKEKKKLTEKNYQKWFHLLICNYISYHTQKIQKFIRLFTIETQVCDARRVSIYDRIHIERSDRAVCRGAFNHLNIESIDDGTYGMVHGGHVFRSSGSANDHGSRGKNHDGNVMRIHENLGIDSRVGIGVITCGVTCIFQCLTQDSQRKLDGS